MHGPEVVTPSPSLGRPERREVMEPATAGPEILLQNPGRYGEVQARQLRPWLSRCLLSLVPGAASLGVRFVSDREMREVNRRFRGQDRATDVLSFPGHDSPEGRHLGDIVISVPAARRQAAAGRHPVSRELKILLLHGVLHCLGYDHESDDGAMERLERELQATWVEDAG